MARSFDGADDRIDFGSDASIDDFTSHTIAYWFQHGQAGVIDQVLSKSAIGAAWQNVTFAAGDVIAYNRGWSGATLVYWTGSTALGTGMRHIVITYDGSDVANDPVITVDGVVETLVENNGPPSGSLVSDAGNSLLLGENSVGGDDLNALVGWMAYDSVVWTAADKNRHRWWGIAPGGLSTVKVSHPFVTADLVNHGTATATGTPTGTTVASLPRVQRPGSMAMMGCGL